jgi:hypothetical protein
MVHALLLNIDMRPRLLNAATVGAMLSEIMKIEIGHVAPSV